MCITFDLVPQMTDQQSQPLPRTEAVHAAEIVDHVRSPEVRVDVPMTQNLPYVGDQQRQELVLLVGQPERPPINRCVVCVKLQPCRWNIQLIASYGGHQRCLPQSATPQHCDEDVYQLRVELRARIPLELHYRF